MRDDRLHMRRALALARRALGETSPNPLVGAVLVRRGRVLGEGWHHRAGQPHAEIEALREVERRGGHARGATLYVTLEPCCTHGRTPPCTDAVIAAGIRRVVVGATDPNPHHAGRGFDRLRAAGIEVVSGLLSEPAERLNPGFNHWIVHRTPFVTLKAALSLDGKIATAAGESKWLTGERARAVTQRLRQEHDAVLVGINTVLADNPALTIRGRGPTRCPARLVLDTRARTPLTAQICTDAFADRTTIVVGERAATKRVATLRSRVKVLVAPEINSRIDLAWTLKELGAQAVTSVLVEGGGEVHAAFLAAKLAQAVAFFYAPLIIGGRTSRRAVAGMGFGSVADAPRLRSPQWRQLGPDLLLRARIDYPPAAISENITTD